ncbi:MAG: GxGYxYP family putative glycoside hydrolase, partial [Verrucomicrobia bacterium]|nr:GxGYxYP family putative glycoside hydrolase [Verrucomicrobiota bacterium]
ESEERLPLSCLQGLVNREQPRIFLVYDRLDDLWLDWLRELGDVKEVRRVWTKELYEQFLPVVKGLVVTDPDLPGSVNVATMLAAVESWLPVTPGLLKEFSGLKVAMDLRGKWKKNIEAYRWFYSAYGSRMSRRVCAGCDPGQFELRDYFVEFKIPVIWVSHPKDTERSRTASPAEEAQFARDLFLKLPPNIPCMGWWDHGLAGEAGCGENGPYSGNDLASQYAKFHVCTAWDGYARGTGNLSVHSGTSARFRQKTLPPPPLEAGKVYYTFTRTDGDGPNFWRQVYRDLWNQPDHGKVPVGWQLGPTTSDLIPDIIDYFYKHASPNDVFVNALTGVGYIREADYAQKLPKPRQEAVWNQYMEMSRRYFKLMDLSLLTTFEAFKPMPPETLARFAKLPGIKAIYGNYHRVESTTAENATSEINGVPVFRAVIRGGDSLAAPESFKRAVATVVQQIRQFTPGKSTWKPKNDSSQRIKADGLRSS